MTPGLAAVPLLDVLRHEVREHVFDPIAWHVAGGSFCARRVFALRNRIQGVLCQLAGRRQRRKTLEGELPGLVSKR